MEVKLFGSIRPLGALALADACGRLLAAGVDGLHVDVADGVFVPELTYGPAVACELSAATGALVDVHLMVVDPERYLEPLAAGGVRRVAFHLEATAYPWRVCAIARSLGLKVGLAVNPSTPLAAVTGVVRAADFLLLLTTEPDLSGERLLPGMVERVADARTSLAAGFPIVVDGGVGDDCMKALVQAGASALVVGRAITGAADWRDTVTSLRDVATNLPSEERSACAR